VKDGVGTGSPAYQPELSGNHSSSSSTAAAAGDKLPVVLATLRRISPYVFEELLLICRQDQGWQIQRNFSYSGDGGIDGRVAMVKDRP
jgi:restriction endonuclease Mrr